ncbi:uncharacterized protein LOC119680656 isoform X2 [Teleopsis dalmanni]|uniref:uncharacterized protein LOC119680656 isoform X2 n=1 Tax=Teleopsis dalmanni TaxID=139649 RepID=UPI0018CDE5B2|nr:uncharacterized protein LOC119680656 isoform X2 [Teleopsis dalmanni]
MMYRKIGSASLEDFPEKIKVKQGSVKKELQNQKTKKNILQKEKLNKKESVRTTKNVSIFDCDSRVINDSNNRQENKSYDGQNVIKSIKVSSNQRSKTQANECILQISDTATIKEIVSEATNNRADEKESNKNISKKKPKSEPKTKSTAVQSKKSFQLPPGVKSRSKVFRNCKTERTFHGPKCGKGSNSVKLNINAKNDKQTLNLLTNKKTENFKYPNKSSEMINSTSPEITGGKQLSYNKNTKDQDVQQQKKLSSTSISGTGTIPKDSNINQSSSQCFATPTYFTSNGEIFKPVVTETDANILYNNYDIYLNEIAKQISTNLNILRGNAFSEHSEDLGDGTAPPVLDSAVNSQIDNDGIIGMAHPFEIPKHLTDADIKKAIADIFNSTLKISSKKCCENLKDDESRCQPAKRQFIPKQNNTFIPSRDYTISKSVEEPLFINMSADKEKNKQLKCDYEQKNDKQCEPITENLINVEEQETVVNNLNIYNSSKLKSTTKCKKSKMPRKSSMDMFMATPISQKMFSNCPNKKSTKSKVCTTESKKEIPVNVLTESSRSLQQTEPISSSHSVPDSKVDITKKYTLPKQSTKSNKGKYQHKFNSESSETTPEVMGNTLEKNMAVLKNFALHINNIKMQSKDNNETGSTASKPLDDITKNRQRQEENNPIKYVEFLENSLEYNIDLKNNRIVRVEIPKRNEPLQTKSYKRGEYLHTTPRDDSPVSSTDARVFLENNSSQGGDYLHNTPKDETLVRSNLWNNSVDRGEYLHATPNHEPTARLTDKSKTLRNILLKINEYLRTINDDSVTRSTNTCGSDSLHKKQNINKKKCNKSRSHLMNMQEHGSSDLNIDNTINNQQTDPNDKNFRMQRPKKEHVCDPCNIQINSGINSSSPETAPLFNTIHDDSEPSILYNSCDLSNGQNLNRPNSGEDDNFMYNPYSNSYNYNCNEFYKEYTDQFGNAPKNTKSSQFGNSNFMSSRLTENIEHNMRRSQGCDGFSTNNFGFPNIRQSHRMKSSYPRCSQQMSSNMNASQYLYMNNSFPRSSHIVTGNLTKTFNRITTYPRNPQMIPHFANTLFPRNCAHSVYPQMSTRTSTINTTNNVYPQCIQMMSPNVMGTTQVLLHQRNVRHVQQLSTVLCSHTNPSSELHSTISHLIPGRRPTLGRGVRQMPRINDPEARSPLNSLFLLSSAGELRSPKFKSSHHARP